MNECRFCGMIHGVMCPAVKAIEYFEDGTVKRVEFKTAADYAAPIQIAPVSPSIPSWPSPWTPWCRTSSTSVSCATDLQSWN